MATRLPRLAQQHDEDSGPAPSVRLRGGGNRPTPVHRDGRWTDTATSGATTRSSFRVAPVDVAGEALRTCEPNSQADGGAESDLGVHLRISDATETRRKKAEIPLHPVPGRALMSWPRCRANGRRGKAA